MSITRKLITKQALHPFPAALYQFGTTKDMRQLNAQNCQYSTAGLFLTSSTSDRPESAFLLLPGGHEALEFLEPVLDEDHLADGRGLPLLHLNHQKSLLVEGQVIVAYGTKGTVSGFLKKQARLSGR